MKKLFTLFVIALVALILGNSSSYAQISVSVDNPTNTTPNLLSSYPSLANAITALNSVTAMTGPVTLTLQTGSETAPVKGFVLGSATLNPVLSATNTITITNSGAVTINAGVGTSAGPSATPDGMLILNGVDYVTINGLTFTDGNSASATVAMEFGIALFKRSAGDGCNNNIIQNCTFNMQRINNSAGSGPLVDGSVAIGVYNSIYTAATTALTPTNGGTLATNGTNSNNKFYTNAINSGNYGIALNGYAATVGVGPTPNATTFLGDINNDIGGTSSGQGNTILNFGGGAATSPSAGIRANNQWSINISYNIINNNNGSGVNHATTLRGIYAQAGTSGNVTITYNTVTVKGGGTTSQVSAIENAIGSTAASNTVNINYNTIENCTYATGTSGTFYNIYNTGTAATVNINNNIIRNSTYTGVITTGNFYCITNTATSVVVINNNSISNLTIGGTATAMYCISVGSPTGAGCSANSNTISNITRTGASGTHRGILMTSPTNNMTFNGNTIDGINWTTVTSTGNIDGIYGLSSATNITVSNNIIRNLSTPTTGTINGIREWGTSGTKIIQNNQIYNFSTYTGGTGGATFNGIYCTTGNLTISGNQVYALNSTGSTGGTGGTINGIWVSGGTTHSVYKNNIYNLSSTSTNPVVSGIINGGGTTNNIFNNYISDLKATASTGANSVIGLNITGGTTINAFYNTIYLNATGGTTFGSSGIYKSSTTTSEFRNNIIVNVSTPGSTSGNTVALRWSGVYNATYYSANSNNNLFYAGTPAANYLIFYDGTNSDQTIAAYKTRVASRDAASFSENPPFVNVSTTPYDLHLQTTVPTQCESGGTPVSTPIAITDDYDGNTRNVTNPDVGADEGGFLGLDFLAPSISYTVLSNTASTSNRNFTGVVITDASGVNTDPGTKPRCYYKRTTDANDYFDNTNSTDGWKYVEANGTSTPFDFTIDYSLLNGGGGVSGGEIVQYFVVAQDLAGTPNVGINSGTFTSQPNSVDLSSPHFPITGTINSYTILSSISGTFYVGPTRVAPNYTTLTAATTDLNSKEISGAVTFILDADYTSATETFPININVNSGSSATNTVTIKPTTTAVISGSSASSIIKINGADYITIDGSNSGSTDRSLTIENTNTATTTAGVWLSSTGVGAGVTYNTIKNCNIKTGNIGTAANTFGIFVGGATINSGGSDNDYNTIQNNAISKAYYGIDVYGITGSTSDNLTITGNSIGSNTSTDYITYRGMYISYSTSVTISQNTIYNVINSTETQIIRGIEIGTGVLNSTISRNNIYNIQNLTTTLFRSGQGISLSTGSATSNITLDNNLLHGFRGHGSGTATNNMWGIIILGGGGYNIYYNSINLYNNGTTTGSTDRNGCIYIASGVTSLDIRNNAFSTTGNPGNATAGFMYNIYSLSANTAFTSINYNDYYITGTRGFVGYINSLDQATLAAWQTATAQDVNSISADPLFVNTSDLRPNFGSPLLNAGTPIGTVTTDYLGVTRSATTPTIGAYEQGVDASGPTITYTAIPNTSSTANLVLTGFAGITDPSGVNVTSGTAPRIYYKKSTDANTYAGNTSFDNGWKWAEASNASTPFDFTIDYSIINGGSVVLGEIVQYFVVAQDLQGTPVVGINSGTFAATPSSVNLTAGAFPIGGTINSYMIISAGPLSGTYTVGLSLFNKVSGKNLYTQTFTRTVQKEINTDENIDIKQKKTDEKITSQKIEKSKGDNLHSTYESDISSKDKIQNDKQGSNSTSVSTENTKTSKRLVNVIEEYQLLMENGKPYDGPLFTPNRSNENFRGDAPLGIYATITAAIGDLNSNGVSGAVTFLLVDATYPSESLPIVINNISGSSATNTVTIKPATGISPSISSSAVNSAIIKLNGADYVTIDGSNNGTSSRDLTISNTNTGSATSCIWLGSSSASDGASYNTIKNCNFTGSSSTTTIVGIIMGSGVTFGNAAEAQNNNNTIQNNTFAAFQNGIYHNGNASYDQNLLITNNTFGSAVVANKLGFRGLILQSAQNFTISGNTIMGVITATTSTAHGIQLAGAINGGSISKNNISDIKNTNTGGYNAWGITLGSSSTAANVTVSNNVIYDIAGYGWASQTTDNGYGINVYSGGGYNLYYNSVYLTTEQTAATGVPACLFINSSVVTASSIDIRNNIFQTTQTIGTNRYAILCNAASTVFSNLNYNNYYSAGPNLGYIGATNRVGLTEWRTGSAQDLFSISGNSGFTSSTNLQPDAANANCWTVNGGAYPIATVTDDYLGNPRNTSVGQGPEDIGAYKVAPSVDPNAVGVSGAITDGGTTTLTFAGTTIATITWHAGAGTLPSSISAVFKPGNLPPGTPINTFAYEYLDITETGGVLPYTYDLTIYYNLARTYTINISPEDNLRVAKYSSLVWNLLDMNTTTNTTTKTVTITGIDNGFSSFTFTGNDSPLPVQLTSFVSSVAGRDVKLTWKTESEQNNAGFEVQRIKNSELNSGNWSNVGYVKSAGNSNTPVTYSFEDKKLNSGKYNYRLKQIDKSGAYKYFSLNNVIDIALPTDYKLSQNYPNPFNPVTKIDFELPFDSRVRLTIYDMLGREVKTLVSGEMKQAGFYTVELNGTNLSSGTYFYRLIANGQNKDHIFTKKMTLVK